MIQSILFFALGFLCAGFLALMVAPAIWRRAVTMTRKRVEASVPLSLTEIQADKDRIRAEFAMTIRKLEMSVTSHRERAAAQSVEIGRGREQVRALTADLADKNRVISELEAKISGLSAQLRQREDEVRQLTEALTESENTLEQRAQELEQLGRLYEEASFSASNRQIELVARESEVEKLADEVSRLKGQRKDWDKRLQDMAGENRAAREALSAERKKVDDLEKRIASMLSTLADRERKLARAEKEQVRLVEKLNGGSAAQNGLSAELADARRENAGLQTALAEQSAATAALRSDDHVGDQSVAKLSAERDRLEARLTMLTRENKQLRAEAATLERSTSEGPQGGEGGDALLREQISALAAEVVSLTGKLEGPGSPIERALSMPSANGRAGGDGGEKITSLADRVRALRNAQSTQ